jgi:hypothetical protein
MAKYSAETRVEPSWMGWLSIAENHYTEALNSKTSKIERERALRTAQSAMREARSMFPKQARFAAAASSDSQR